MRSFLAVLVLMLLYSAPSFAESYKWYYKGLPGKFYDSPDAACPQSGSWGSDGTWKHDYAAVNLPYAPYQAQCYIKITYTDGGTMTSTNGMVERVGDECPNGGAYNERAGTCEIARENGEICDDQSGNPNPTIDPLIWNKAAGMCVLLTESDPPATCKYFGNKGSKATEYTVAGVLDQGGEAVAPPTFAIQMGCEVQTVTTSECTINVKGAISCNVTGTFTGNVGQTGKPNVPSVSCGQSANLPCPTQEVTTSVTDNPCVMNGNKCTSETETSKTGKQQCGSVNGTYTCTTVKPTSNGLKIATEQMMKDLADGSVKTTKTDKATKTKCTDVKNCKITTSTTVTETTTNKEGKTTSKTSTCYGECGASGTGLGTGLGGNGNGKGDGDTATGNGNGEEEGDDGGADASDDCTKPPACDGDAYLCSILRQSFINSCAERALPSDKEKLEFQAVLDKQKLEIGTQQKEMDDKVSGLVSAFQSSASGGGGGGQCFKDKTFSAMGHSITLPFSQGCFIFEWVRYAMLALAYIIAFRMITKEL